MGSAESGCRVRGHLYPEPMISRMKSVGLCLSDSAITVFPVANHFEPRSDYSPQGKASASLSLFEVAEEKNADLASL